MRLRESDARIQHMHPPSDAGTHKTAKHSEKGERRSVAGETHNKKSVQFHEYQHNGLLPTQNPLPLTDGEVNPDTVELNPRFRGQHTWNQCGIIFAAVNGYIHKRPFKFASKAVRCMARLNEGAWTFQRKSRARRVVPQPTLSDTP